MTCSSVFLASGLHCNDYSTKNIGKRMFNPEERRAISPVHPAQGWQLKAYPCWASASRECLILRKSSAICCHAVSKIGFLHVASHLPSGSWSSVELWVDGMSIGSLLSRVNSQQHGIYATTGPQTTCKRKLASVGLCVVGK